MKIMFVSSVINASGTNYIIPTISMSKNAKLLDKVFVSTTRSIIEVKADRTIFNVQGTINASGQTKSGSKFLIQSQFF